MSKQINLQVYKSVLEQIKSGFLLIHKDGKIIDGNEFAFSLLKINTVDSSNIRDYLAVDVATTLSFNRKMVSLTKTPEKYVDLKTIHVWEDLLCVFVEEVSLKDHLAVVEKQAEELIQESTEGYLLIYKDQIIDCDREVAYMFGYNVSEMKERKTRDLFVQDEKMPWDVQHHSHAKKKKLHGLSKKGVMFPIELTYHTFSYEDKKLTIGLIKNISERLEHEKRLEYMAYYDGLTDLPNMHYFTKVLKEAICEAHKKRETLAVFFIDLDYFKEINETLGYEVSDQLLIASGERLKKLQREDTFVARVGGDEFLILQRNISKENQPDLLAEKIISAFKDPVVIHGYEVFTSVSIGISIFPEHGVLAEDLIKHAVSAMYVIKEEYRNDYNFFESSISEKFQVLVTMESDLRRALKNNEFELLYQPQKSLRLNKVIGMEALIRWKHPQKGYIPPMDFIPFAEKTGLIIEIGDWVLREACAQNKRWQDEGYEPIIMSVNLSARQFHQKNLVEKIEEILEETGLEAKYLELEITESMAMSNEHYISKTMNRLRNLGVYVSIDDFGTGYSSLKYLSKFPITKLKIDKMFMNEKQKQNRAIVKSIINMSHSLNLKVIAEGVETYNQLEFLKKQNCDEIQGFLYCKPLPPSELKSFLNPVNIR